MLKEVDGARTMLSRCVDGVFVVVHTAQPPDAQAWTAHCKALERELTRVRGMLVFTAGGGPSSKQRGELHNAMRDAPAARVAIMNDSAIVRGIVTSLNWFANNQMAAFPQDDLEGALRYVLGGDALTALKIRATLLGMAKELGVTVPLAR